MNSGSSSSTQMERGDRKPVGREHGNPCGPTIFASVFDSLREEGPMTTRTTIEPKRWFCFFQSDTGPMAVSLESVAEVFETDTLVRLAWSPPQVVGLCSYHREVVPVVVLGEHPRVGGEIPTEERDPSPGADPAGDRSSVDGRGRSVVLILKTEQGAWGIRVDSGNTIMSRETPAFHPPRMSVEGPVLIGDVHLGETCHQILDAEATWRGLRSAVGRWSSLTSESYPSSPTPSGEEPIPGDPAVSGNTGKHEPRRG
jgi:chemotaxis signal transduction protein